MATMAILHHRRTVVLFNASLILLIGCVGLAQSLLHNHHHQHQHPARIHYRPPSTICRPLAAISTTDNSTTTTGSTTTSLSPPEPGASLHQLKVAVVGAGPSGLLLAHLLLKAGCASCHVYERRARPAGSATDKRAYALGLGRRGRTAVQAASDGVWQAVRAQGFPSERFDLQLPGGGIRIRLRDAVDGGATGEPSLLLFQTDLCRVLTQELEREWLTTGKLKLAFDTKVTHLDLVRQQLTVVADKNDNDHDSMSDTSDKNKEDFDLVVGCDGVNSMVRQTMDTVWPAFKTTKELIPGLFKVVRLDAMPPKLDATAVALVLPIGGSVTAFVEPTIDGSCCILFTGNTATDSLLSSTNTTFLQQEIYSRFPLLQGADLEQAALQLSEKTKITQASLVKCNTFHYDGKAVLVGDAAHATGGVSGQGVNSALMDSVALVASLLQNYKATDKQGSLRRALLAYSQVQVPEGQALYELSFGPNSKSIGKRLLVGIKTVRDSLFKGRWGIGALPLRTLLTTSLQSFADLRRDRDELYDEDFPKDEYWRIKLCELDATVKSEEMAT